MTDKLRFILASASPRRRELLQAAGYRFDVTAAEVDEDALSHGLRPLEVARLLAQSKANVVAERAPESLVLAADTVVALGEHSVGKPTDADDARRILRLLEGTTQIVITGVCLLRRQPEYLELRHAMSAVRMRRLSAAQIDGYVAGGDWQGKAGAYGIQDRDPFVRAITGSMSNIVGLPMELVGEMLARVGVMPSDGQAARAGG